MNLIFSSLAKNDEILFLGIGCDQEALEFFKLLNFAVLGFAPKTANL